MGSKLYSYILLYTLFFFSQLPVWSHPWADTDIMVLVDERGVPKFCLQELYSKVSVDSIE